MNIFFTIITPVFNNERFLSQYFESLLKQNFVNFEVIIINDGSTDNSLEIINKYKNLLPNIVIINQKNSGQGKARNKALKLAKGEYILFIDSDDTLSSYNSLYCLYNFILNNSSDIVFFAYQKIYGKRLFSISNKQLNLLNSQPITSQDEKIKLLYCNKIGAPWNKAYKKDFLTKNSIKFAEQLKYEDAYFFWQVIIYANKISFYNHVIYLYRKHKLATMRSNNKHNLDIIVIYSLILDLLIKENLIKQYYTIFLNRALKSFKSLFKKTPYIHKKVFFMKIKDFIVKYSINSYIIENKMLSFKSKIFLKALNTNNFPYFYVKTFLL